VPPLVTPQPLVSQEHEKRGDGLDLPVDEPLKRRRKGTTSLPRGQREEDGVDSEFLPTYCSVLEEGLQDKALGEKLRCLSACPPFRSSILSKPAEVIESAYRVHDTNAVRYDVTKLTVFPLFRLVNTDTSDYRALLNSLQARSMLANVVTFQTQGPREDNSYLVVWHPDNKFKPGCTLVVDGNHRVTALKEILANGKLADERKDFYRYVKVVIVHPNAPLEILEALARCK